MKKYILGLDQGTTGSTAMLVDMKGKVCGIANKEFKQIYPFPGWVEHSPKDIWTSLTVAIKSVLAANGVGSNQIECIGITNQRETSIVWDRVTGQPLYNAIVWQCRRTKKDCDRLIKNNLEKSVKSKTGLLLDPYFSASKFSWILKNTKSRKNKNLAAGTIDSFILSKLTKGGSHFTDVTNASRTSLMNINKLEWDKDLCKVFKVPMGMLPEIKPSNSFFGVTEKVAGLPKGIPIYSMIGDQQAALFGQSAFSLGEAKCTFGTGSFILMNCGHLRPKSKHNLLETVAWQLEGQKKATYALEGGAFVCGAAVQWLRDGLGLIENSSEIEKLAKKVKTSEGVEFVPALTGLGAPYWKPDVRGTITGLTRGTNKNHIARATLEAMALQNVDILNAMQKDINGHLKSLKVDGGATVNKLLMEIQADYLGVKIELPKVPESTVFGAALMAGLGAGIWTSLQDLKKVNQVKKVVSPKMKPSQRKLRLESWKSAIGYATDIKH